MKKTLSARLLLFVAIIAAVLALQSCKKYVVKPEDIQAYLDKGVDLTITLPANSTFDLINVNGERLKPSADNGANGEKEFQNAAAFVQKAYAAEGAYRCPTVCQIVIKTPQ